VAKRVSRRRTGAKNSAAASTPSLLSPEEEQLLDEVRALLARAEALRKRGERLRIVWRDIPERVTLAYLRDVIWEALWLLDKARRTGGRLELQVTGGEPAQLLLGPPRRTRPSARPKGNQLTEQL
jgi:hypothetical protein